MRLPSLLPLPLLFVAATASATTQQPLQPLSGGYSTLKTRISKLLLESSGSNKNKVALVVEEEEVSTLKSFSGRDIPVLKVTSAADTDAASSSTFPSRVLVVGSFAGNESNVVGGWCLGLVEALLSNINTTAITTEVFVVPVPNPDGLEAMSSSSSSLSPIKNNNTLPCQQASSLIGGVNLAHNFGFKWDSSAASTTQAQFRNECSIDFQGKAAFSEPETRLIQHLIQKYQPTITLFYQLSSSNNNNSSSSSSSSASASASSSAIIFPFTFHTSPPSTMRKSDIDTFNTLVKTMNQNSGNIYRSSGWAVDILGNTVSGSEIDWTFAEGASYSMRVYMDDVNVSYDKHIQSALSLIQTAHTITHLQQKSSSSSSSSSSVKHILMFQLPLTLGLGLALVLVVGVGIARYGFGITDIYSRVRDAWTQFGRYRGYTGLKSVGSDGELDSGGGGGGAELELGRRMNGFHDGRRRRQQQQQRLGSANVVSDADFIDMMIDDDEEEMVVEVEGPDSP